MLPLISIWEREKLHPCSAAQGFGVHQGTPGNPNQPPRQIGGEEGKSILIKLRVQTVWLRELPQPTGKSDRHPALNQLAQGKWLFTVFLWQVGAGRGIAVL